ncbi:MAG: ImmA/IrrE family metallo-endopeptidase, partial [Oryzomonas sp.]
MVSNRIILAREALRAALEIRRIACSDKLDPISIYDLDEKLGIEVKFLAANSFGGMYSKTSQTIIVPSLRPAGRQAFTCAHEIGHWCFGHGTKIDEISAIDENNDPEEFLANLFAGFLLMPPWAVESAFSSRKLNSDTCTELQFYGVSCQLGVGYETLIQHLRYSMEKLSSNRSSTLLKARKTIKILLLGKNVSERVVFVDTFWCKVPVDVQ